MRKPYILFILLFAITACTNKPKQNNSDTITVSILPQKFFVEQIAGTQFPINVMLPPGASPADYEPTPKQVQDLSNSGIYFFVGHLGFEKSWMVKFSKTAKEVNYISCSDKIDLLRNNIVVHDHEDLEHRHGTDPHIWTSPENVKTISRTICNTLSERYPEKATEFENNLHTFTARIDLLDNSIRNSLVDSTSHSFMIFHPALGYFARDYHLEQHAIEFDGKSPSPTHLKRMIDLAKEQNISTIFVQSQFETSKAEAVAKEIDAEVISIDPLAENWLAEMYALTKKMQKALSK
ncbi:MAG: zinc ABC transporter substrate-binding protein [Prolixibacteraceae bacterium]|jgi:zinc transport system substrate-binding protein|nr:zinc ABC transporter substrate-binding protein [Prolixibacteraceae bacterium]